MADLRRPHNGFYLLSVPHSETHGAGNSRFQLAAGGRFPLLLLLPSCTPADAPRTRSLEVAAEGGFLGQFNRQESQDNSGWDGFYGVLTSFRVSSELAFKVAVQHDSSHTGDEFTEQIGQLRYGYTREEVAAGVAWQPTVRILTYGEYAVSENVSGSPKRGDRAQTGLELSWPLAKRHSTALYGAIDLCFWEDDEWEISTSAQLGFRIDPEETNGRWRTGLQYYEGRSVIGEFFMNREAYFGWGVWIDL